MAAGAAELLRERFGLTDDELLVVLDAQPLELLGGDLAHKPEPALLLALTDEPLTRLSAGAFQRWLRTSGPRGTPVELLLARDFGGFERALEGLDERGFVVRRRNRT